MSPEELWQKLVDETGDALVEEAAAVSVAQAEQELVAAGFDMAEVHGQADAFLASLTAGAAIEGEEPAKPADASEPVVAKAVDQVAPRRAESRERKKPRPMPVWVAAAAATVAAGAAVAYVATRPNEGPRPVPTSPPSTVPPAPSLDLVAEARDLRRRAAAACDADHPEDCLRLLDEAKAKDPAGDTSQDVQALRQQADVELHSFEAKPK